MATLPKSGVICFLPSTIREEEEAAAAVARESEERGPQDGAEDLEEGDGASKGNGKLPPCADEELEAAVLQALVDLLARGLCHQVHREVRTGLLTMADIYNAPGRHGLAATAVEDGQDEEEEDEYDHSVDIYGQVPPKEPRHSLACAACGRPVGVGRYAPHLDKCLGKGKAGRSGGSQRCKKSKEQQQQQQAAGGGGGNGAGGKKRGPVDGGTLSKKARKKKDQNKHPLLHTYVFPDAAAPVPAPVAMAMAEARAAPVVVRLKLENGAAVRALPPADWPVAAPIVGAPLLPPSPTPAVPTGRPRPPSPHQQQHQRPPQRILPRKQAPSPPPLLPHPGGPPPMGPNGGMGGMVGGMLQPRPSTPTQMGQQTVPMHMLPGPNGAGMFVPAAVHAGGQPTMMQQPHQQQGGLMFGGESGGVGPLGRMPMQPMPVQGQPVMVMAGAPGAGGQQQQQQQQQFFAPPPLPYGPVGQPPPPSPPHGYGYQYQYQQHQHQQPPPPQGFGGSPPMPPSPQS